MREDFRNKQSKTKQKAHCLFFQRYGSLLKARQELQAAQVCFVVIQELILMIRIERDYAEQQMNKKNDGP